MEPQARAVALSGQIAEHKAAMRRHRHALAERAAELAALKRECASRGIRLVLPGEGENPWPNPSSTSTP